MFGDVAVQYSSKWSGRHHHANKRRRALTLRFSVAIILWAAVGSICFAATLPAGFTETRLATGLVNPTAMAFAPDGRLFVCEQTGRLRVIKDGTLLATPFLTVTVNSVGERGLLGVAFEPDFFTNQYVYVYYTATTPALHNRVSRFTANGDVAAPGSEVIILELNNLSSATNHNGGAIHFGADGKLYIAVGENANPANSQTLANLLGKLLRLNRDGTIPTDNPFFNLATGNNRAIWALGLRNPFTFAVQPGTGRIFINDVGQNTWEEINEGIAGANYGWPATEGATTDPRFVSPLFAYGHGNGNTVGCSIAGGAFYNPPLAQFPSEFVGNYFFADFCSGWIRRLNPAAGNQVSDFATGISFPVDLKVGPDGHLYYLARGGGGSVFAIQAVNKVPAIAKLTPHILKSRSRPLTLTITGTDFTQGAVVQWNGQDRPTRFINGTELAITLSRLDLRRPGTGRVTVINPPPGGGTSNVQGIRIIR